jgi:hypothetical protein
LGRANRGTSGTPDRRKGSKTDFGRGFSRDARPCSFISRIEKNGDSVFLSKSFLIFTLPKIIYKMEKIKKYYPFWLGVLVCIFLNGNEIIREAPSIGMLLMYLIGFFKWTKLHD